VLPAALWLPGVPAAFALSTLIAVPGLIGALNGALLHTMVKPEGVARGTGIYSGCGSILSAAGPVIFGSTITWLDGSYWGGFAFLAVMNIIGAICYYALHVQERGPIVSASAPAVQPLPSES
jgi:MFS-type transporter involved in bile tolerance (Atg22 family)